MFIHVESEQYNRIIEYNNNILLRYTVEQLYTIVLK